MNRMRLWTAGLVAQVDSIVGRIENHEAVAASTLRATARAMARARVRLARVARDGDALRERLARARDSEVRWRERAEELAARDEGQALECLRRRRAAERDIASTERRLEEHERTHRALAADVAAVEQRFGDLRERHHVLATRESRAEAFTGLPELDALGVFERWEESVAEREITGGIDAGFEERPDHFETELDRSEEEASLRAELAALRGGKESS